MKCAAGPALDVYVCPVELMKEPVCVVCCVRRVCVSCRVDEGASVCGLLR